MNDRLTTLVGALIALAIGIGIIYQPNSEPAVALPLSTEPRGHGLLGMQRWLEDAGITTTSWRLRLTDLEKHVPQSRGNVLVMHLPGKNPLRESEAAAIKHWLTKGNSLVLAAALNDTPSWSSIYASAGLFSDLRRLTGLEFVAVTDADDNALSYGSLNPFEDSVQQMIPYSAHPLAANIEHLVSSSDLTSQYWRPLDGLHEPLALRLAYFAPIESATNASPDDLDQTSGNLDDNHPIDAIWEVSQGDGRILLLSTASMLSNKNISKASNGQFLANIIAYTLAQGGEVIFDDFRHGLSSIYDPSAFYKDSRLHISIGFILAFWFIYVVASSARLGPLPIPALVSRQEDLAQAIAKFLQRKLTNADTATLLLDNLREDLAKRNRLQQLDPEQDLLELLSTDPMLDQSSVAKIQQQSNSVAKGEKIDLKTLHNNIVKLTKDLA